MWAPRRLRGAESACSEVAAGEAGSVPGWEDPLEEGVAAPSSCLPVEFHGQRSLLGGLQSTGSQRVGHN